MAPSLGVGVLSANVHGMVTRPGFTIPHAASFVSAVVHLAAAPLKFASNLRFASRQVVSSVSCLALIAALFVARQPIHSVVASGSIGSKSGLGLGGSHSRTVIVDVVPPLEKLLMTSTSPILCTPLNFNPPPSFCVVVSILFWRNQKACWASPLLSKRSEPKYKISHFVVR